MIKKYKHLSQKRLVRVRSAVMNTERKYKLAVHKTNKYLYAQVVELVSGKTLFSVGGKSPTEVGKTISQKAVKGKIKKVVFDRGKSRYHGKVKLLAETAREGGLEF
jgi:large subunit ribosomal protein L18